MLDLPCTSKTRRGGRRAGRVTDSLVPVTRVPETFMLALAALFAATSAADTTRYVVLNHGRDAGAMVVVRAGDSVAVSYNYIDRNRGQRIEGRYRMSREG